MVYRCIAPHWLMDESPNLRRVHEGEFSEARIAELNSQGYNIYFLPNEPSSYDSSKPVTGADIDQFNVIFVDMDLKDGTYASKEDFYKVLLLDDRLMPTRIIDSGNGVHVYWNVSDLDAMSYLKLQRRLMRKFNTDEAVGQIYQLMRLPNTLNTKEKGSFKPCEEVFTSPAQYSCEQVDLLLAPLTPHDEAYCNQHYNKTYCITDRNIEIDDVIPLKFHKLLASNKEVKQLWVGSAEGDRSANDFRLGHIMFASGFTKTEAISVLVNTAKALERAPIHRISYATNIVDKVWGFEVAEVKDTLLLSKSVKDILLKHGNQINGTRFPCYRYLDNTEAGYRLGQVIGLVAGSGVGKTAIALNMFLGFVQNNPAYEHFFVSLEQPENEIAARWEKVCGEDNQLHSKVHIIDNYEEDGTFRDLSLKNIQEYILKFQRVTGKKVGCVVIDHIGVLAHESTYDREDNVKKLAKAMKSFALTTNTLLVMQSQTSREKAGIGDLELNKDAAFGTSVFENFCDYLVTLWQPLKRCYKEEGCPTVTAFKFCKIRHKNQTVDVIKEDTCYRAFFDSETQRLRPLTQDEEVSADFFLKKAIAKRSQDRKTEIVSYTSVRW